MHDVPVVPIAVRMNGRRRDDITTVGFQVDAREATEPDPAADLARAGRIREIFQRIGEVVVLPVRAGMYGRRAGKRTVLLLEVGERLVATVTRIDVEND